MISYSNMPDGGKPHDIEYVVRNLSGASAARIIGASHSVADEHSHDWPVLSLYVMGEYRKMSDHGEWDIRGPSVILHGPGEPHANQVYGSGLEQVDIQFDPRWLGFAPSQLAGMGCWVGGRTTSAGSRLLALWLSPGTPEGVLRAETRQFLDHATHDTRPRIAPSWVGAVSDRLTSDGAATAVGLASEFNLHPTWLAQAYRAQTGEGLRQTVQRRRVQAAASMLRDTDDEPAEIAAEAGFYDQSHMNRAFRQLLGRTPGQVRNERTLFRPSAAAR